MSRLHNNDGLEKQLADLNMSNELRSSSNRVKKIPPAVPPKKKAQPQVPHSAVVNSLCEPSYSTEISAMRNNNSPTYSNMPSNNLRPTQHYANVIQQNTFALGLVPRQNIIPSQNYNATYRSIPPYRNSNDSLPPPPPPPPPSGNISTSASQSFNNHDEEYLPPPSPVSSNYSELARATANLNYNQNIRTHQPIYQNEFSEYATIQSPTYESLYEPINPLPQSIQSNGSNEKYRNTLVKTIVSPLPAEKEVDALTNLLVQSISDSQDLDVFGICVKCAEKVVGENSGCTAMGNMYHVQCFSCHICNTNLQDKPFYSVEGQPYCEADYYETLEKCCVCDKPILDRILRATGKPYHPKCFTCVECGKSLDGIPFTVDALNQIYCVEDFHKKFAPLCSACSLPIMPEEGEEETVRVVALDRSFHVRCYRCEDCGLLLSSRAEGCGCYPLDERILCKNCNALRVRLLPNVMTTDL